MAVPIRRPQPTPPFCTRLASAIRNATEEAQVLTAEQAIPIFRRFGRSNDGEPDIKVSLSRLAYQLAQVPQQYKMEVMYSLSNHLNYLENILSSTANVFVKNNTLRQEILSMNATIGNALPRPRQPGPARVM